MTGTTMDDTSEPTPARAGRGTSGARVLVPLAAAVLVLVGLGHISFIVGPVFLALVLAICVYPIKQQLISRRLPAALSTLVSILAVYAMLAALIAALWVSSVEFTRLLPQFTPQMSELRTNVGLFLRDSLGIGDEQARALVDSIDLGALINAGFGLLGNILNLGAALVFLCLLVLFMCIDATYYPTILSTVKQRRAPLVEALANFAGLSRTFMVMTTIFGAIVAVLNLILLWILGVPGAGLWAMLAFVCGFIPFIGFWISLVPAAIMALLSGGLPSFIVVVVFYGVINSLIQSVIQPKFVAGSVNLNMTLTFLSVIFWSAVLGPVGALMAVPLTLFARAVLVDAHPGSAWLRPLLGDLSAARTALKANQRQDRTGGAPRPGPLLPVPESLEGRRPAGIGGTDAHSPGAAWNSGK